MSVYQSIYRQHISFIIIRHFFHIGKLAVGLLLVLNLGPVFRGSSIPLHSLASVRPQPTLAGEMVELRQSF